MDSKKLEAAINERILNEQKSFKEQELKRINTIQYKYGQIMNLLDSEFSKIIDSYNEIMNLKFSDFKLRKFYGSSFLSPKNDNNEIQQITIMFISDKDNNVNSEKDINKYDNIIFKFKQRVKRENNELNISHYFSSLYQFENENNVIENKELEIDDNELNQEIISNKLMNFFYEYVKIYLKRGRKLKPYLRMH